MKDKIKMVIFILVLGSFLTMVLVGVNNYTVPMIEANNKRAFQESVLKVFNISFSETNRDRAYLNNISDRVIKDKKFYISKNNNIAFEIIGSGVQGPIRTIISMSPDMETIDRIVIIHQEETPGLGSRIAEKEYLDQFRGKKFAPDIIVVRAGKAKNDNEVNGITGATFSCNAFGNILNTQAKKYIQLYKENQ